MAIRISPLPLDVFTDAARPFIARLNRELRDLSGLEGTISEPRQTRRSDDTIARREAVQVAVSRITPDMSLVVSGVSTVVGIPALTFGLTNTVGTTSSALSINSAIALFSTAIPPASDAGAAVAGLSAFASNLGTKYQISTGVPTIGYTESATGLSGTATTLMRTDATLVAPSFLRSTANGSTLALTDDGTDQTLTGDLGKLTITVPGDGVLFPEHVAVGSGASVSPTTLVTVNESQAVTFIGFNVTLTRTSTSGTVKDFSLRTQTGTTSGDGGGVSFFGTEAQFTHQANSSTVANFYGLFTTARASGGADATRILTNRYGLYMEASGVQSWVVTNTYTLFDEPLVKGDNVWSIFAQNKSEFASASARAETVISIDQLATGNVAGAHINLDDKAGDPPSPNAGDIWRNVKELNFSKDGTNTIDLVSQLSSSANDGTLTLTDDGTNLTLTPTTPGTGDLNIIAPSGGDIRLGTVDDITQRVRLGTFADVSAKFSVNLGTSQNFAKALSFIVTPPDTFLNAGTQVAILGDLQTALANTARTVNLTGFHPNFYQRSKNKTLNGIAVHCSVQFHTNVDGTSDTNITGLLCEDVTQDGGSDLGSDVTLYTGLQFDEMDPTFTTTAIAINSKHHAIFENPSDRPHDVLTLNQKETDTGNSAHLKLNDKTADPATPVEGMLWRNKDNWNIQHSTGTREPFRYALMAGS